MSKVATNYSLIQKEKPRRHARNEGQNELGAMENDDHENENFNIEIEPNAKCHKHNSPIHSYVKSNKVLLCTICIQEGNYDKSRYKPITQVVKETRGGMNSYKLKLNQSLLQLKRFKEVIELIKEDNRKKVVESVQTHFNKIYKIVKNAENLALQKLDIQFKKQEKRVKEL